MTKARFSNLATIVGIGASLGLGFVLPQLWWVSLVGLVSFLFVTKAREKVFWFGWGVGTVKILFVIYWFWYVYPLDWIGLESRAVQIGAIFFYWLHASIAIGSGLAVFAVAAKWLLFKQKLYQLIGIPLALVVGELFGSVMFSLNTLGSQSDINIQFSFGYLGYTLASHSVLNLVAVTCGVYALSFVVGVVAVLALWVIQVKQLSIARRAVVLGVGLAAFVGSAYLPLAKTSSLSGMYVAAIHLDSPGYNVLSDEETFALQTQLRAGLTQALKLGADYIVVPESAELSATFESDEALLTFLADNTWRDVVLIDGVVSDTGRVTSVIYDAKNRGVHKIEKKYLVPQGEYMPSFHSNLLRALGRGETVDAIEKRVAFTQGENKQSDLPETLPAILFCFDSVNPLAAHNLRSERLAPFIAHQVSHGWFHDPFIFRYQLDQMLKVQAVYSGLPIVQATNRGLPLSYLPDGSYAPTQPVFLEEYVQVYLVSI